MNMIDHPINSVPKPVVPNQHFLTNTLDWAFLLKVAADMGIVMSDHPAFDAFGNAMPNHRALYIDDWTMDLSEYWEEVDTRRRQRNR